MGKTMEGLAFYAYGSLFLEDQKLDKSSVRSCLVENQTGGQGKKGGEVLSMPPPSEGK